jgi:hypothetical protein
MYFPSDTQLSSCWIRGFAVLSNTELVNITNSEGFLVDALAPSIFPVILITVCDSKRQIIAQIAAQSCYQAANNGKICFTDFPDMNIGNSYITISDIAGIGFATCFALKVYYDLQVPVKNEQN